MRRMRPGRGTPHEDLAGEDNETGEPIRHQGLQEAGHTTDMPCNGRDGMFLAASEPYDVIVMDRMLPGVSTASRSSRSFEKAGKRTPILI